jgi:hypothetical protein
MGHPRDSLEDGYNNIDHSERKLMTGKQATDPVQLHPTP